jgi:hypothetical protein
VQIPKHGASAVHNTVQTAEVMAHAPPALDADVVVSTVVDAPLPTRVHVGHTRELEPADGNRSSAAKAENCVKVTQVSVTGAGAVHTPLTQVLGEAQVAVEQAGAAIVQPDKEEMVAEEQALLLLS